MLEQSPELLNVLEEARQEYKRKGGVKLKDYLVGRKKRHG